MSQNKLLCRGMADLVAYLLLVESVLGSNFGVTKNLNFNLLSVLPSTKSEISFVVNVYCKTSLGTR